PTSTNSSTTKETSRPHATATGSFLFCPFTLAEHQAHASPQLHALHVSPHDARVQHTLPRTRSSDRALTSLGAWPGFAERRHRSHTASLFSSTAASPFSSTAASLSAAQPRRPTTASGATRSAHPRNAVRRSTITSPLG